MPIIEQGSVGRPAPELNGVLAEWNPEGEGFIADAILRPIPTKIDVGKVKVLARDDYLRREDTAVAPGGTYPRGAIRTERKAFACVKNGHEYNVTDEDYAIHKTSFDAEAIGVRFNRRKIAADKEVRVRDLIIDTAVWTGSDLYTDNSSNPWDDITKDIIGQVIDATEKVRRLTGMTPNVLIASRVQLANMLKNTGIKAQFPTSVLLTRAALEAALGPIFGLRRLLIGGDVENTAAEGQDGSYSDIWSDDYAMVARVAETDNPMEQCIGRTMRWTALTGMGVETYRYLEPQTDSTVVKSRVFDDELLLDAYCAHLMKVDA